MLKSSFFSMSNPASKFRTDNWRARKHGLIIFLARHLGILLIVLPQYALRRTSQPTQILWLYIYYHLLIWIWTRIWSFWSMIWYHLMNHMASMIATKPTHPSFHPTSTKLHRASVCKSPHLQTNLSSPSIVWALKSKHDLQLNLHVWAMSGFLLSYWFWDFPNYSLYHYLPKGITVSKCSFRDGIEAVNHFTLRHLAGGFPGIVLLLKKQTHKISTFLKIPEEYNLFCADGVSFSEFSVVLFR